ncbi:MAG TPA: class I SAM-dependent methyltransferase [Opitutaceae bacterium]|jgi:SAM-dependent methyltransferase|nr:class I SAM-dependent methyltransferase [Opitutaceae bacterium]
MNNRSTEAYGQHGVTWVDRCGVWLSQRAIRRWLPPRSDLEVLELGCGYRATQLLALRDRLKHGTGVDFHLAPELCQTAGFSFHEGSIEEILPGLAGRTYDVVLLISVLEHLHEPQAAIEAAGRLLRPGGSLLINVPTWRGKHFLEFSAFRLGLSPQVEMDDHKMYYGKKDLWPLLVRAGFKPSRIRLFYHKFGLNLFATAIKSGNL